MIGLTKTTLCLGFIPLILIDIYSVIGVNNANFQEGESCLLPGEKSGTCRKMVDCPQGDQSAGMLCQNTDQARVVCCLAITAQAMCKFVPFHAKLRVAPHIVGIAEMAEVGEFPFMGLLMYSNPRKRCAAVLISSKHLLTAAHCFRVENATFVRLGTNSATDKGAEPYKIVNIVTHPDYKPMQKGSIFADLAIVQLRDEIEANNVNIAPLCLFDSFQDPSPNENMTVVGWGTTDTGTESTADTLMKGTVRVSPHSKCQTSYKKIRKYNITSSHLCAQGDVDPDGVYTDSCWGDSGGPLVKLTDSKYYLVGIISSGHHCGLRNFPGVYTRSASYLDWIMKEIETKFS